MTSCGWPANAIRVTLEQIADDFGIHAMTLSRWLRQAAIDDGDKPGVTSNEARGNRELRKRIRLLEHVRLAAWSSPLRQATEGGSRDGPCSAIAQGIHDPADLAAERGRFDVASFGFGDEPSRLS